LEQLKKIYSVKLCKNPDQLRNTYDRDIADFEKKTIEINIGKVFINDCINTLENCKNLLLEIEKVLKEIIETSNTGRVGTLFGICKQTIKENKIPMDENEETVFSLPYDEKDEIEKFINSIENIQLKEGGKNNTKRKNYIAKNVNNKKSKKRRFKCAKV